MECSNIINALMLLIAIVSLICSNVHANKVLEQTKTISLNAYQHFFNASFSELYLNSLLSMPDQILAGTTDFDNKQIQKHMNFFFDICNEVYRLHKEGLIDGITWKIWENRIAMSMKFNNYKTYWKSLAQKYDEDFFRYVNNVNREQQ